MSDQQNVHTGGCQCGAVRFRVEGALDEASVCHCRMCQKAFGNLFAPLTSVRKATLTWTRGERAQFRSSSHVQRGFCRDCGTPLTYEAPDGMALAVGAFDHPERLTPTVQYGLEGKLACVDTLAQLPGSRTDEDAVALEFLANLKTYQHPDHDTETWPPEESA